MDSYTEAILAFLEGHKAVAAVRYQPSPPCVLSDLVRWEARNQPFKYAHTDTLSRSHRSPLSLPSPLFSLPARHETLRPSPPRCATQGRHHPWEMRRLPADLQAFMHVSNGFSLCWDGRTQSHSTPVGSMCLNAVADIKPVPLDFWCDCCHPLLSLCASLTPYTGAAHQTTLAACTVSLELPFDSPF